ncbi:hypothetical protein TCA2_4391 [Paenibacillus sp. TCA20]|nr:hypothetical protein TCA2_4391 [Paenibacillus sp. TCA20]
MQFLWILYIELSFLYSVRLTHKYGNEYKVVKDSMAKGKGGTGRGTGKKGWNRWQASERRAKSAPKPYKSKGTKKSSDTASEGQK